MTEPRDSSISSQIQRIADSVQGAFRTGRRVLSFAEYLQLFEGDPVRHARDACRYLRDVFDHFGTRKADYPWGRFTRWNLFDLPWESAEKDGLSRGALVGQEQVQEEIYRAVSNFAREGRANRLILLHGPNGSAKSTIAACLMAALEQYSLSDDGALYRFNWVFPSTKTTRGTLGFAQGSERGSVESYAHLPDDQIDAKLLVEVRDHPLFLIPVAERQRLLKRAYAARPGADDEGDNDGYGVEPPAEWIARGMLSHKSQQVFEALLASYHGSYKEVLKHVQVERYFISRRYRTGAVTIGPQVMVDAGERQITADKSLGSLPVSLQALTLFEARGELIDAAGGLIEFSDLLKRPLDAFKYLQLTVETGEVALSQQNVQLNCVMMGSANELHFDAFREHVEFASFRGRLDLIRTPYLRSYVQEQTIYDTHVIPQVRRHVAPHATEMAAMFAVLTRMRKPDPDRYPQALRSIVSSLTAAEKLDLYGTAKLPERFDAESQKLLHANIAAIYNEGDSYPIYEGRIGASPREIRAVLLDAAQSPNYSYLSPLAVLSEIEALCENRTEFEWLQQEPLIGGYHDVKQFTEVLMGRLLASWEREFYASTGLVIEERYAELLERYVQHVSSWVKKERIFNRATGAHEDADERLMAEAERLLDEKGEPSDIRPNLIGAVAAWSLDHPNEKLDVAAVFPHYLRRIREAMFAERRPAVAAIARDVVIVIRDKGAGLDAARTRAAEETIERLITRFSYRRQSAGDMASTLLRRRFHDLVV